MNTMTTDRHLTDTELLRVMDEGDTGGETAGRTRHLEACALCTEALETLQRDSRLIGRYLEAADFEDGGRPYAGATERWRGTRPQVAVRAVEAGSVAADAGRRVGWSWLKAAAVIVLVAGPLAAFPDVRSWVAERVPGPAEPDAAVAPAADAPTVLRFTPDPGDFVIRFPAGAAGAITLERSADTEAELRATGGDPETVVSASSLEIRNAVEARYRLRLPTAVTGAWVVVGERAVAVNDNQIDRRTVITLDG